MKKILPLIFTIFLLASCTESSVSERDEISEQETNISSVDVVPQEDQNGEQQESISSSELFSLIPQKYQENSEFLMCIQNNIDGCIQQSAGEDGVDCEDFILDKNKQSCFQNQVTIEARESNDPKKCRGLPDVESCEYEVVVAQVIDDGDISVCQTLKEDYRINCNNFIIQNQAREAKDSKLCDKILPLDDNENLQKDFCVQEIEFFIEDEKRNKELLEDIESQESSEEPDLPLPEVNILPSN